MSSAAHARVFTGTQGRVRSLVCALLYAALAFWLLSADGLAGPVLRPLASALHVGGLDPGTVALYETANLVTALVLTALYRRTPKPARGI